MECARLIKHKLFNSSRVISCHLVSSRVISCSIAIATNYYFKSFLIIFIPSMVFISSDLMCYGSPLRVDGHSCIICREPQWVQCGVSCGWFQCYYSRYFVIILSLSRILSLTVLIKSDIKSNCAYPEILSFFRSLKLILSRVLSLSIGLRIMSYIKSIWDCVLSRMISPTVIIQIY